MLQPLASSAAVMSDQDIEAGIAILDIGGGTTDLAVFYEGILKHTAVIPFGGENITNDIKLGLGVLKTQAELMKVQYGSALADAAQNNAFIKIPGLRGLPSREISVKNLASIIQARMSEILAFVTFHLKQVGLDNKMLNGGIVLTGGGSQLKHLIQLTEYATGLNARIGYPNEHLAASHIEELEKPMYSTCIGLILKGYNVYENNQNRLNPEEKRVVFRRPAVADAADAEQVVISAVPVGGRKTLGDFMNSIKDGLIDLFKEEGDRSL
jgi:cell division protein FtsA